MRTAIIKAMPAAGGTKIIGDQPAGNQSFYFILIQKQILFIIFTTETTEHVENGKNFLLSFLLYWRYALFVLKSAGRPYESHIFDGNTLLVKYEQTATPKIRFPLNIGSGFNGLNRLNRPTGTI